MAIYMKIDGIDGNVSAKGHEKWIELERLNFGVGRGITSSRPGNQTNREASTPSFSEISISKEMDETTPKLFIECCVGKAKTVQIHLIKSGDNLSSFMEYTLSDVLISGYSVSSGSADHPVENINLNYSKIEMKYIPYTDEHGAGSPIPAGYDLVQGAKV